MIGDVGEFYDYSQNKYGKVYRVSKDTLDLRARSNAKAVNEQVRRRDKGPNIIEKIQKSLKKAKKKKLVQNLEGYFKTVVANGIKYKVRLTDMSKRTIDIKSEIDPHEEPELDQREEEPKEAEGEGDVDNVSILYFI